MSEARYDFLGCEDRRFQKNLAARHVWNSYVDLRPILRVHV